MSVIVAIYPLNIFRYLPEMISLRHIVTMMMMIWMQISIVYGHFDLWPSSEGKWCLLHMITPSLLLYTCFGFWMYIVQFSRKHIWVVGPYDYTLSFVHLL